MSCDSPGTIAEHQKDYKDDAWKQYTVEELGWWVHLFTKRAHHRDCAKKKEKDLYDAKNYLAMMNCALKAATAAGQELPAVQERYDDLAAKLEKMEQDGCCGGNCHD